MNKLIQLLESSAQTDSINLDYENIRDLTRCMSYLQKFENLKYLSLHGNKLKLLPNGSNLKQLTHLDLTKNQIKIDSYLLDSLFAFPKLQHLLIDGTAQDMEKILENLPNLKYLNNKKIIHEYLGYNKKEQNKKKHMLQQIKNQLEILGKKICKKFQYIDANFLELDMAYKEIYDEFSQFSDNVKHQQAKDSVLIYSKNKMLDVISDKLYDMMEYNQLSSCAQSFEQINMKRKQYFDSLFKIVLQIGYDDSYIFKDQDEKGNRKLRKQKLYFQEIARLKGVVKSLKSQVKTLQEQNAKYLGIICSYTINNTSKLNNQSKLRENKNFMAEQNMFHQTGFSKNSASMKSLTPISKSITPSKSHSVLTMPKFNQSLSPRKRNLEKKTTKTGPLTLEQTYSLTEDIIKEKQIYNRTCFEKKESFSTAQQFLCIYFTRKYGLKSLSVNSSLSFIQSLEVYCKKKTQLEVFLKILKNDIEESFYQQHKKFIMQLQADFFELKIDKHTLSNIFYRYFPTQSFDQYQIPEVGHDIIIERFLKIHIEIHEKQLAEFRNIFKTYDRDEEGILTLPQSKKLVLEYFEQKIQKGIISDSILDKIENKFSNLNQKKKIVFSELVEIVDNM